MAKNENFQALAGKIDDEAFEKLNKVVLSNSIHLDDLIKSIVSQYCKPLDELMARIASKLADEINPPTNDVLDDMALNLSACLYYAGEGVEIVGIREDVAKALKMEKFNTAYDNTSGTIGDKTASGEIASQQEYILHSVYTRAYKQCKYRLELGNDMLQTLKKVISRRMSELQLSLIGSQRFKKDGEVYE